MPVRVRAEQPVQIHFRTLGNGKPGIRIAISFCAVATVGIIAPIPADLRLRYPKRFILYTTQKIVCKGIRIEPIRRIVMVILHHV